MVISKLKRAVKKAIVGAGGPSRAWDMSTKEAREGTVQTDYEYFRGQRAKHSERWKRNYAYYDNKHVSSLELQKMLDERGIPWSPAIIPDPYIHVETQIDTNIPGFEFNGRDDDLDNKKAKQREYVVKYVIDNNPMEEMNSRNERSLGINGNAFWKVSWNSDMSGPGWRGNIEIGNPDCANMLNEPSAYDIEDGEAHIFAYRMHKRKAARVFARELEKLGKNIGEIGSDSNMNDTEIYGAHRDPNDETVQVVEYWFRQPTYGEATMEQTIGDQTVKVPVEWEPGDIACSIQINFVEVKYIPKYWVKTGKQNKRFPFVKYCRIPALKSFWDISDIDKIVELTDSADRELAVAILNDAFMANDIILEEEGALAEGSDIPNVPGARVKVRAGKINAVRRLGGLSNLNNGLKDTVNFLRDIIKQTVGNFDVNMGDAPPGNVRTLGGLVELKEQGNRRQNIKKTDRKAGFARLYELIDWTALEFFDDNRMIFLGAETINYYDITTGRKVTEPAVFQFNSDNFRILDAGPTDETGVAQYYYPTIDAKIDVGDDIQNSKAMTLMATDNLLNKPITPQNWKVVAEMLDILGLPNRKELKDWLEQTFGQMMPGAGEQMPQLTADDLIAGLDPDEQSYLNEHPEILDQLGGEQNAMPGL